MAIRYVLCQRKPFLTDAILFIRIWLINAILFVAYGGPKSEEINATLFVRV